MKRVSSLLKIVDLKKLKGCKSEMKQISRAKSTSDMTRLQFNRMIKLIDEILDNSMTVNEYSKKVEIETAKRIKRKWTFPHK